VTATAARPRTAPRKSAGLYGYEATLRRAGLAPVAGVDEAGRGACAGPLVAAAVVLPEGARGRVPGLADSKLLTPAARERVYAEVVDRAVAWSVVGIEAPECDRLGMHVADITALRRALARLAVQPAYLLSDGFAVAGAGVPNLAVWKGDRVAACVAAASVIAKVTRDRIMTALHEQHPQYGFDVHKGYCTADHQLALDAHGPCPEHRRRFINVREAGNGVNVREAGNGVNVREAGSRVPARRSGHNDRVADADDVAEAASGAVGIGTA
jgi:ribonuclease HII